MSGVLAALMGARRNGGPVASFTASVRQDIVGAATASAQFTLNSDGTTLRAVEGAAATAGPNWYQPTTPGIGSSFTVNATVTGSVLTSGTTGSPVSLASAQTWRIELTTPGAEESYLNLPIQRLGITESVGTVVLSITKEP